MFNFIRQLFGREQPRTNTRLTEQQAISIARSATADDPLCEHLAMTIVEQRAAGAVWIIGSATIGISLEVIVDDTSGEVIEVKRAGLR